jgi:hypothetical protein
LDTLPALDHFNYKDIVETIIYKLDYILSNLTPKEVSKKNYLKGAAV